MEAPRYALPPTMYFIGPCLTDRAEVNIASFPFEQLSMSKPKIYISLGTVFNKKPNLYHKIISAFNHGRYQLIVSAGGAYGALRKQALPDHVLLFKQVPQFDILRR